MHGSALHRVTGGKGPAVLLEDREKHVKQNPDPQPGPCLCVFDFHFQLQTEVMHLYRFERIE